jgi:hypothetical protein
MFLRYRSHILLPINDFRPIKSYKMLVFILGQKKKNSFIIILDSFRKSTSSTYKNSLHQTLFVSLKTAVDVSKNEPLTSLLHTLMKNCCFNSAPPGPVIFHFKHRTIIGKFLLKKIVLLP